MNKLSFLATAVLTFILSACATRVYYNTEIQDWREHQLPEGAPLYSVYLLGDAGEPDLQNTEPVFQLLKNMMAQDPKSALVVLGDNVYHDGLPPQGHHDRETSEQKLIEQLKIVENHPGKVVFIPGNHDWNYMSEGGLERVKLQEEFVESYLKKGNTFLPDGGCPGPVEVELSPEVVVIAIDTQWWFHEHEKPYGRDSGCAADNESEMLRLLGQMLERNQHRHIIVAGHHPLMSNSNHGGYYSIFDHLFPLTLIRDGLYIPMPVLGSLYPFYRKFGGVDQDIPHPRYQLLINELRRLFRHHDNIIYAAGHDHNLQLHRQQSFYHILSGSGAKSNHIVDGNDAEFVQRANGFVRVLYYPKSEVWAEFWTTNGDGSEGVLSYRTRLYTRRSRTQTEFCDPLETTPQPAALVKAPDDQVSDKGASSGNLLWGRHYSREWTTPISIPVVNLRDTMGGLVPYNTTGSPYHQSLRLRNPNTQEYLFRSLSRNVLKVVPEEYRQSRTLRGQTRNKVVLQHPYAPLIVSRLEKAAGVPFNNPTLVILPDSKCLGPWQENFAGMIGYLEEHAEDRHLENPENLANSGTSLEYESLIDALERNQNHQVNEKIFARLRLLDMLVGDWDRHERQYHWIARRKGSGVEYLPVAEDRDNAFFSFEGPLPWLISRNWAMKNLQHFGYDISNLEGLNNSARSMDRRFLTSLTREDWISIAQSLRESLNDQALEEAVKQTPKEVWDLNGPEIIEKLKTRREQLPRAAEKYYELLARYVDVYGTDNSELFEITRLNREQLRIRIASLDSAGTQTADLYERIFNSNETKEVRLYGLEGNDVFINSGEAKNKILVRIIGGKGLDRSGDTTLTVGRKGKTLVYDDEENPFVLDHTSQTTFNFASGDVFSSPNSDLFFYNQTSPQFVFRYNHDDGLMPGIGIAYRKYKFRSHPFGAEHRLLYHWAFGTASGRLSYSAIHNRFLGNYDLVFTGWTYTPYYYMNFWGWGNNSKPSPDKGGEYYQVRLHHTYLNASFNKTFATFFSLGAGPKLEIFRLSRWQNNYLEEQEGEINPELFSTRQYLGLRAFMGLNIKDNFYNPTRGLVLRAEANLNQELSRDSKHWGQYTYQVGYYMSPELPYQLTFAGRLGGVINKGSYEFYQAAMLGSGSLPDLTQNLRGYPKTRFIGHTSLYTNLEMRLSLLEYSLYLLPAKTGIIGLFDTGRVWATGEKSSTWHKAYGGGVWLSILNRITLSATLAHSKEGNYFNIQNGFFF